MSACYQVILIHDQTATSFADEVREEIKIAASKLLQRKDLVGVETQISTIREGLPVVVVYLASVDGQEDRSIRAQLDQALDCMYPVLPLVRDTESHDIYKQVPEVIQHINTAHWSPDSKRTEAVLAVFSMLGLAQHERKVFLSYRRTDSTEIAIQIHNELAKYRFDVFLDRFALPPGSDFQQRLREDLADKAFVVLIESPNIRQSKWVQHEVTYALSNRISVISLRPPNVSKQDLIPSLDPAFRLDLNPDECRNDGTLTSAALDRILSRIQIEHAAAIRRRREQLLGSLREILRMKGGYKSVLPVEDRAITAMTSNGLEIFLATPRVPRPADLFAVHRLHGSLCSAGQKGCIPISRTVVHEVDHILSTRKELLEWISKSGGVKIRTLRQFMP